MRQTRKDAKIKRYYAICRGYVQGIGFRFFVQHHADSLGLNGWVRNLPDGSVDMEVDGEESNILNFLNTVKTGHPWAKVRSLNYEEKPCTEPYKEFFIKHAYE